MIQVKKFEAKWCGPCKALKPIFENVSNKFGNNVNFSYIDIDEQFEELKNTMFVQYQQ